MTQTAFRPATRRPSILSIFSKYPDFRRYYIGLTASVFGYRMIVDFSLGVLIYDITGDERYLGYMALALAVPTVSLNLFGGVFADKFDPRRLMGVVESLTAIMVAGLGVLTFTETVEAWHVILAGGLFGTGQAFGEAARASLYARLIERRDMTLVVPLNSIVWPTTRAIAPFAAGYIAAKAGIGTAGVAPVVFAAAGGFMLMAIMCQTLTLRPSERASRSVIREMITGVEFIVEHRIFLYLVSFSIFTAIFGMSYLMFMPAFAKEIFDGDQEVVGTLLMFAGLGSIVGLVFSMALARAERRGLIILGGAIGFGTFIMLFAMAPWYPLSLAMVLMAGVCNSLYLTGVMTTLQMQVPDALRGRVMGIYTICYGAIPLGTIPLSQVSHLTDARVAVAMGGALVVGFAICVALFTSRVRSVRTSQPSVVPQEAVDDTKNTDDDNDDDKPDGHNGNQPDGDDGNKPGGNGSLGSRQPVESSRSESRQSTV